MTKYLIIAQLNIESRDEQNKTIHLSIKYIFKSPFIKVYNVNFKT